MGPPPSNGTLLVAILTLGLTVLLYIFIPKGFFRFKTPASSREFRKPLRQYLSRDGQRAARAGQDNLEGPAVESLHRSSALTGPTTPNSGRILINLKPLDERKQCQRGHPPLAAGTGSGGWHHSVHAGGARYYGGRPGEPHAIQYCPDPAQRN